jgi:catechol 2,3-dioxygenase-like lactoylglutathione lyase family enzyme
MPNSALFRRIRQTFAAALLLGCFGAGLGKAQTAAPSPGPAPLISHIKMVNIAGPDLAKLEEAYTKWFGFKVMERKTVSPDMAASWGVPAMANRPFILLGSDGTPGVFVRCLQIDAVPNYKPLTTTGWNAFELIVDDLDKLRETLKGSPFKVLEEPHFFDGAFASAHAMAVEGPAKEIIYLTSETGDRAKSFLPIPKSQVDRPFVVILGAQDAHRARDFYAALFKLQPRPDMAMRIVPMEKALGLPPKTILNLSILMMGEKNNSFEIDNIPTAKERPQTQGQLAPGNAMVSLGVPNIDDIHMNFIAPPKAFYGPRRSASFVGPAGERVELIEDVAH